MHFENNHENGEKEWFSALDYEEEKMLLVELEKKELEKVVEEATERKRRRI